VETFHWKVMTNSLNGFELPDRENKRPGKNNYGF
jgi:hypothetical protein